MIKETRQPSPRQDIDISQCVKKDLREKLMALTVSPAVAPLVRQVRILSIVVQVTSIPSGCLISRACDGWDLSTQSLSGLVQRELANGFRGLGTYKVDGVNKFEQIRS
jgi:hypothetical protein